VGVIDAGIERKGSHDRDREVDIGERAENLHWRTAASTPFGVATTKSNRSATGSKLL